MPPLNITVRPGGTSGFEVVPGRQSSPPPVQLGQDVVWRNQTGRRVVFIFHRWAKAVFEPTLLVEEVAVGGTLRRTIKDPVSAHGLKTYKVYVTGANIYADGGSDPGIDVP